MEETLSVLSFPSRSGPLHTCGASSELRVHVRCAKKHWRVHLLTEQIVPIFKTETMSFWAPMHPRRGLPAHPWRSPEGVVSQPVSSRFWFPMAFYGKWPLTTITKLDGKSGSCSLFWLWEPFCETILVPSESHCIFGITLRVQWKALRDPIY